jgi:hypothetical protein
MGYLHINNLYKDMTILLFKECFALEKIHGTSAHISFKSDGSIRYFAGGESHPKFVALFDETKLLEAYKAAGYPVDKDVTLFGEAYGGKQQGMSATYGPELKFAVFDVKIGDSWLDVPKAEAVAKSFGLEFVFYQRIPTDIASLDAARDMDSPQAIRNGVGAGKKMEGVVLRPIVELTLNNGSRVIVKHKRDEFRETSTPRFVDSPDKLKVLADAEAIAKEWVTENRWLNATSHFKPEELQMENFSNLLKYLVEDVVKESTGEILDTKEVRKAISKKSAGIIQNYFKSSLKRV